MTTSKTPRNLIIFDFDYTFVELDSEYWVFEILAPELRYKVDMDWGKKQWSDIAEECFLLLAQKGITRKQVEETVVGVPLHPVMKRAVETLKARSDQTNSFLLLSNANTALIKTILAHHGLSDFFEEIISNEGVWEGDTLEMSSRVDPKGEQHKCTICEKNMCKGDELDAYIQKRGGWDSFDRVSYCGDGYNDFCPVLRLRENDWALVRSGKSLEPLIVSQGTVRGMKSRVKFWAEPWELERIFNAF